MFRSPTAVCPASSSARSSNRIRCCCKRRKLAEERSKGFNPGSIHIPLDELRAQLNELPRDREIVVHCQGGQHSCFACRILSRHGFRVRNLTGSYRTWKTATSADGN
jgi:rhodanese-related sulfurtransferase